MKKDTYYFPHDSNARTDPALQVILFKYGLEGYGAWWFLLEKLRESSSFRLPFFSFYVDALAQDMNVKRDWLEALVADLVDVKLFSKQKKGSETYIFSKTLDKRMQEIEEMRLKKVKAANARWRGGDEAKDDTDDAGASQVHRSRSATVSQSTLKLINIPFDVFWEAYDYKVDRKKCEKKWNSLSDAERSIIMSHVEPYKSAKEEAHISLELPMTYLNNERWEVDPATLIKNKRKDVRHSQKTAGQRRLDKIRSLGASDEQDGRED